MAAPAAASTAEPDPVRDLKIGDWNARIGAVAALGRRGEAAFPELKAALEDPDWQVRLSAVHWLSSFGPAASPALETALRRERCPIVRLAAANRLGGMGAAVKAAGAPDGEEGEALSHCKSWTWPLTEEYVHARKKKPKQVEASKLDARGCQYIQFKNSGRDICPEGFLLKGVGTAPGNVEILYKKKPPRSGVALCCRAGEGEAVIGAAKPPEPEAVECRLHPIECPAPWVEMQPPDNDRWTKKGRKFRRTPRIKRGGLVWLHCCRPHQAAGTEYFPKTDYSIAKAELEAARAPDVPVELPDYVEEEEDAGLGEAEAMPEREIAARALAKRRAEAAAREASLPAEGPEPSPEPEPERSPEEAGLELRRAAFEKMLSQTRLPPPLGAGPREESEAGAQARREETSRAGVSLELEAPSQETGEREARLAAPSGIPARADPAVRGRPEYMEDAGKELRHDPLPELLEVLKDRESAKRSRAIDEIGALGPAGMPALRALKGALKDGSPRVRSSAALALGGVTAGSDAAVRELKSALKDKHLDVRYSAAMALGRVGTEASGKAFEAHMRAQTRRFLRSRSVRK